MVPALRGINIPFIALALALLASRPARLHSQSFLEKLESAVRERLNEPVPSSPELLPTPSSPSNATAPPPNQPIANPLLPSQKTDRVYLGLEAEEVTGGGIGVLVTSVTQGSPAWNAGFQPGDRITAIDGFAITNLDSMVTQLGRTSPGQATKFLVARADRNIELVAVVMEAGLAERIAGGPLPTAANAHDTLIGPPWLGLTVSDLTQSFRHQFGIASFRGAAVTNVATNSPAASVGIKAGDAVLSIGGNAVESARDLTNWLSNALPGQQASVTFQRGTITHNAVLTLEATPEHSSNRNASRPPVPGPIPNLELTPSNQPSKDDSQTIIEELRRENERLRAELQNANQVIESTQKQLKQIRDALGS